MKRRPSLLLLSCRSPFLDDDRIYPPLANLYLKAYVQEHMGYNVEVSDQYDMIETYADMYDYIGISIMTPQRDEARRLALRIRKSSNAKIILGGPHVKHYLDELVSKHTMPYDYLVPYDGEKALVEILQGTTRKVVGSIMSKDEILNAPRPDRTSLDAFRMLLRYNYKLNGRRSTTMLTARGCPERCTFCEDAQTAVKWSSLANLREEMDDIVALGYKGVYIFDDLFALAKAKIEPICRMLKERDLIYRCNGQARYFTKDESFAALLAETGCYEIAFGAESGSQKILDNIEKRTTVEQNYKFVELCKKHGIVCKAFILLGLPGEDETTLAETERFIATSGIDDAQIAVYYPYKGTKIRDALDRGELAGDIIFSGEGLGAYGQSGGRTEAVVATGALSRERLLEFRDYLVTKYKPSAHDKFFEVQQ
jgi:anaerobic magnesium-protoporphyrin IX monomethyl ester cyclase